MRYPDENYLNPVEIDSSNDNQIKVKRILVKRTDGAHFNYLIQLVEEPAQNAVWLPLSKLPPKAQNLLITRSPPLID